MFDDVNLLRWILACLGTALLLGAFAMAAPYLARRLQTGRAAPAPRRLKVVESLWLDSRRRLLLVDHDGRELLLLLGPTTETVIPPPGGRHA
jgi:flagellar protein FliO/FliZ